MIRARRASLARARSDTATSGRLYTVRRGAVARAQEGVRRSSPAAGARRRWRRSRVGNPASGEIDAARQSPAFIASKARAAWRPMAAVAYLGVWTRLPRWAERRAAPSLTVRPARKDAASNVSPRRGSRSPGRWRVAGGQRSLAGAAVGHRRAMFRCDASTDAGSVQLRRTPRRGAVAKPVISTRSPQLVDDRRRRCRRRSHADRRPPRRLLASI